MPKFIDLDTVRQPIGAFQLAGKTYDVWPLRIEQIINLTAIEAQNTADMPQDEQFKRLVQGLKEAIPDCPEETLLAMDMNQFNALSTWIRDLGTPEGMTKNEEPPTQAPAPATETAA